MRIVILALTVMLLIGCQGTGEKRGPNEVEVSAAGANLLEDVRMAFLGKKGSMVLVSASSDSYLKVNDDHKDTPEEERPLFAYEYVAPTWQPNRYTKVRIVEPEIMAQLLNFAKQQSFYQHAVEVEEKKIVAGDLPGKSQIIIDKDGTYYMWAAKNTRVQQGQQNNQDVLRSYLGLIASIRRAPGHDILVIRRGAGSGVKWLQQNQE